MSSYVNSSLIRPRIMVHFRIQSSVTYLSICLWLVSGIDCFDKLNSIHVVDHLLDVCTKDRTDNFNINDFLICGFKYINTTTPGLSCSGVSQSSITDIVGQ